MFTRTDRKLSRLQDVPLFRRCDRREIETIGRLGDLLKVEEGRVLIQEGRSDNEALVIVEGSVSVSRDGVVVATLGPGDVVGEVAALDRGRRTATVTAITPVEVLVFDPRSFASLLYEVPGITRVLVTEMGRRIRRGSQSERIAVVS